MAQPRHYVPVCDAELGDARCGVHLAALVTSGVVGPEPGPTEFTSIVHHEQSCSLYDRGIVHWTTGGNAGTTSAVKACSAGVVVLEQAPRVPMQPGDCFALAPTCDHRHAVARDGTITGDCGRKFSNVVRFRGFPAVVPPANVQ